jgi:hypothetical protein
MNTDAWIVRAKQVLSQPGPPSETVQFAIAFLTAVYGSQSMQMTAFTHALDLMAKAAPNPTNAAHHQFVQAQGAIRNTVAEIEGGLIGRRSLRGASLDYSRFCWRK